jgi:predicted metal-dependent phosphotriesterase family hydrolase
VVARTVLGDLDPAQLGVTDAHDHLFFRSPLLPGQELDDAEAAAAELQAFADLGGATVVQWTPAGMGHRADDLAALAHRTGVNVIAATGAHQAAHYEPARLDELTADLADRFVDESPAASQAATASGPSSSRSPASSTTSTTTAGAR